MTPLKTLVIGEIGADDKGNMRITSASAPGYFVGLKKAEAVGLKPGDTIAYEPLGFNFGIFREKLADPA